MKINMTCQEVCTTEWSDSDVENFKWMIQHDYTVNFNIDNLPGIYNKYLWEDDEIE